MTASEMGKKGGRISAQNRFKNKSKEEISKIMKGVRHMKSRTERQLTEKIYLENEGTNYRSEPTSERFQQFVKLKTGEKKLELGNIGFLEAIRFGDEITEEEYSK